MSRQISAGTFSDGCPFQVENLTIEHLPDMMALQAKVTEKLVAKSSLSPLSEAEFTAILSGNGSIIGVFSHRKLIAFRAMLIPEIDDEHLGIDAGLPKETLPEVIYSEVSNVDPDYRGNKLQTFMGELLMKAIDRQKFRYVCATVAPMNIPSMKDKFALGLHIVALKEKYGGIMRYILIRDLKHAASDSYHEKQLVLADDISKQQQLIKSGFRGVFIRNKYKKWHVLYVK